jgi:hypothetical protein
MEFQRVSQRGGQNIRSAVGADQKPCSSVGLGNLRQRPLPPFDGQKPLTQYPITFGAFGGPAAHLQPTHGQQDRPVLVQDIEVGLDPGGVSRGHPRVAVAGVAGRAVGAQLAHT